VLVFVVVVVLGRRSGDVIQVSVYLPKDVYEEIRKLVKEGRYPSTSAFIRRAVQVALYEAKMKKDAYLPF
jgi:Arc/MetJ-type ribon-helix-helix transcriptional regulator